MIGINEELKTIEAAMPVLSTNPNSKATIRVLREAKYVAALAMTTLPSDKPLNDARHAVVITLSDLVKALETDPTPQQEKIDKAKGAIRILVWDLKATKDAQQSPLVEGDELKIPPPFPSTGYATATTIKSQSLSSRLPSA